ncbi:hypothetical protein GCM10027034_08610 [Ramlibacter solisilvae]
MRPASLTAAAPPSRFQVTQSVRPIDARASIRKVMPVATSLTVRVQDLLFIGRLRYMGCALRRPGRMAPSLGPAPGMRLTEVNMRSKDQVRKP